MTAVFLGNDDISAHCMDVPLIVQNAGDIGQLYISDLPEITGENTKGFWDTHNPASPFFGVPSLAQFVIRVFLDNVETYTGTIQQIRADNGARTAAVTLRSTLQRALDRGCVFTSANPTNPGNAARDICIKFGIPFDGDSFTLAAGIYGLAGLTIYVELSDPNYTVLQGLQELAMIGTARIYAVNGILFFDPDRERLSMPIVTITDSHYNLAGITLDSHPTVEVVEKEQAGGYSVEWVGGIEASGGETDQARTVSGGNDAAFRILTQAGARTIGERWLTYLNRPQERITVMTRAEIGKWFSLGYAVKIEYEQGGWEGTVIDLVAIDNSTKVYSTLTGLTR